MKTILITGGTGSLGRVVVERLLRGDYRCAVLYRSSETWQRLSNELDNAEQLVGLPADLEDDASVRRAAERAAPLHALVHLAGGYGGGSSPDDFTKMIEINLMSAVRATRAALPHLGAGGRIVAISSSATLAHPPGVGAYVVSKSALNAWVQTLAGELRERGITANALLPGTLDATLHARVAETIAFLLGDAGAAISGQLIAMG